MRRPIFILLMLLLSVASSGQMQPTYNAFTVNDGLPSNYIYRCVEDNRGFLWVATDAGMARFDGKRFQVFTTRDGLTDNEVLATVKEKNGRVWANCFKQTPSYFDEVKNRFINGKEDANLAKIKEGAVAGMLAFLIKDGIEFSNANASYVFKNGRLSIYSGGKHDDNFYIKSDDDGANWLLGSCSPSSKNGQGLQIYRKKKGVYTDSLPIISTQANDGLIEMVNGEDFYLFKSKKGKCFVYKDFKNAPARARLDSIATPEPFNNAEFTSDYFYLLGDSGKAYLYNKSTLKLECVVSGNYLINSLYKDAKGNVWVSTIDKGLLVYKSKQAGLIATLPAYGNADLLSITRKANGTLMAGNYYGEVMESGKTGTKTFTIPKTALIARQRKIIVSQNKVFTFSEAGAYVNYTNRIKGNAYIHYVYGKTALAYNDSIIIIGQTTSMMKLNTITEKVDMLPGNNRRITALARDASGMIYSGATNGLYKYDYLKNQQAVLVKDNPLLNERVTGICVSKEGLIWVATSGNGVLVLKNDKILFHLTELQGIINNATRCINTGRPGQVWLGTSRGISVINYQLPGDKPAYHIQNLSANDGLVSNIVNEMIYSGDTVFAATGGGVSAIPADIAFPKFNIPVQLIRLNINQRDTTLAANYKLAYQQRNVVMEFAGIELGGHFKNLQYTLDKASIWTPLSVNTLAMQLSNGQHILQVRAVDVNGNISNKTLTIKFDIATPFWLSVWFWLIAAIMVQVPVVYLVNSRQKKRKEARLAREIAGVQTAALEQQAFTSLMNPHFIFNALNSIQHYINVQDRKSTNRYLSDFASLIRKNFEAAQQSFIPLEQEMENIKIYLRLEQMRFSERFSYQLEIADNVDTDEWMVPTMILQPLLENALLHGLMPSVIPGELTIAIHLQNEYLQITITDNGIGLINSVALKGGDPHKSRGTELIKKRLAALNHFGSQHISMMMLPAYDNEKNPGNLITLAIPAGLYQAWLSARHI